MAGADRPPLDGADHGVVDAFWQGRAGVEGPRAARFHGDHDPFDLAAIERLAPAGGRMLDLGCGTCVIANRAVQELGLRVHAVDYVADFLAHAIDDERLTTAVGDVRTYVVGERFDLITSLGVITYLEPEERAAMYGHCLAMLEASGALLVKAQFGVDETVRVDTWSEELDARYRAVYPSLDEERALLEERFTVEVLDPYPPGFSRWENTHFHHLVARPR